MTQLTNDPAWEDEPTPTGEPGYVEHIEQFVTEQRAEGRAFEQSAEAHRHVARAHREIADYHDAIANAQERLSHAVPDADQATLDTAMWARSHDRDNEVWALTQDRALNVERDQAQANDHAGLVRLEGQIALLAAAVHRLEQAVKSNARCGACPEREVGT